MIGSSHFWTPDLGDKFGDFGDEIWDLKGAGIFSISLLGEEIHLNINYPEGARSITGIRVKRHASDDAHNKEKSIMKLNPKSSVKLERSPVNSFKISSLPKQNDSSAQALIFDDPLEEDFYEQQPEVKVHNLIVINNTEYIISRQDVFFAVEKFEISTN
ncbi:hypothetical protein AVEN_144885-1 [Araneus ventricosus]|uniref:Uncharacterized protein n=1 Tax=Araneus ventricosus TaxID=182803 RepID=A0A4Y2EHH8_ARAVE|nr:hypothetical protein AVEN_144885-1 [Araneus ventricosus]